MKDRYLASLIQEDALLKRKIAFISGPRQVGKTSMAEAILKSEKTPKKQYFTWDDDEFRKIWVQNPKRLCEQNEFLVLDEIHKDRLWKNKLKGIYDLYKNQTQFLVTGSARLDFFRKSGDSLQGRYLPYRLHPFSANEMNQVPRPPQHTWDGELKTKYNIDDLLHLGGFPEPFFDQSEERAQRWRRLYRERMVREDLRDLMNVRDVEQLKTLAILLEEKAGSSLSYESLRQDLKISFDTTIAWIELLEAVFYHYRIKPFHSGVKQSLRKEPKGYLYDWSYIKNPGHRFENLIASHLLKSCHAWTDCAYGEYQLYYLRDKQKREVDFFVTENGKPYLMVEVKSGDSTPTSALKYFSEQLKPKFTIQVVRNPAHERATKSVSDHIQVIDVRRFLSRLV